MKWILRIIGLSIVIDIGFIAMFGWGYFQATEYWKSVPMAGLLCILWWAFGRALNQPQKLQGHAPKADTAQAVPGVATTKKELS